MQKQPNFHEQDTILVPAIPPAVIGLIRTRGALMDFLNWTVGGCWKIRMDHASAETLACVAAVAFVQQLGVTVVTDNIIKLVNECVVQNLLKYYGTSGNLFIVPREGAHIRRRYEDNMLSRQ